MQLVLALTHTYALQGALCTCYYTSGEGLNTVAKEKKNVGCMGLFSTSSGMILLVKD